MRKERKNIGIDRIQLNTGQLDWLPRNPRTWTQEDIDRTAASIEEDPDFLEERPILVVPFGKEYVAFGGNLRHEGCAKLGRKTAPCVVYYPETDEDRETIKRRAMKDNGTFGKWDWDTLANEWDDEPLPDWGVPAWEQPAKDDAAAEAQRQMQNGGLSTKGREGDQAYKEFVDKFNIEKPLTTDDCYTPPEVYEAVKKFVSEKVIPLEGRQIIRPFFPGGDYEDLTQYPKGCVVLDNPPFSLYSKIVRFYLEHGIDFWLFGPQLSMFVRDADCCFCCFGVKVVYENGAQVSTGFATNLRPGVRIWVEDSLRREILRVQKQEPTTPVYEYPDEVTSSGLLGKIALGAELEIRANECEHINNLDGMKEIDKGIFGGGFLLSRAAAEKARAAAEKARAAAEKARAAAEKPRAAAEKPRAAAEKPRAVKISLSPREVEIVNKLSGNVN